MSAWPIPAGTLVVVTRSEESELPVGLIVTVTDCIDGEPLDTNDGTGRTYTTDPTVFGEAPGFTLIAMGPDDFVLMPDGEP